jgi:hypothetical protein
MMQVKSDRELVEEMGDTVSKQLIAKNKADAHRLGEKFKPQTPSQIKFYGQLMQKKYDYVDALSDEDMYEEVPPKEGVYQLCTKNGFFSEQNYPKDRIEEHKNKLFHEYMQSESETYKEFAHFTSKL